MNGSVRRKYMVVIATVVLSLPFAQLPVTTANAAICQGEAAYPPDLPDCLSPVVAAAQAAEAQAAVERAAKAAADRAAQDAAAARAAAEAAAERAAAEAARIKAASDKAAADALAEKIREGNLAAAAAAAAEAAAEARRVAGLAATAKRLADEELTRKITAQAAAQAAIVAAQEALVAAQARIAREIEEARAESERQRVIAVDKKRLADAAAAVFAAERIALDRAIAEKEALRIAKEAEASASASATATAEAAYKAAGGSVSLRMADSQISTQSVTIKKQELLTETSVQSNLKIQSNTTPVFVTADELASLRAAYLAAKVISDRDSAAAEEARTAKRLADEALAAKALIASEAQRLFREAAQARTAADNAAVAAAAERTRLENAIKDKEALALTAAAEKVAAQAEVARKAAAETVANNSAASMESASSTLASITSDSGNSASLASQALAAFQNVAAASSTASNAAAASSAAADLASNTAAAAVRAREEAAAAAALAARTSSPSANVTSAEARAAQEAANKARELERQAQEAARLAAEAKAAEEKAAAEKLAAEEAAAKAKAAADRAAAQSQAKEEAKRKAARNQIAKDKSTVKKLVEKIKDTAEKTDKSLNTSSKSINSAYESAISEAAKSNKALATLKKEENLALANLNYAKNELLALGKSLKAAADDQKEAITAFGNAQYKVVQLENEIDSTKTQLTRVESEIKGLDINYKELTTKYDSLNKVAQSAISAAEASKKNAEMAYKALLQASNSNNLVANNLDFELNSDQENSIPDANATSALNKIKEAYQNAQNQANKDKVLADRATKDAAVAREALLKAKQVFQSKQDERSTLKANLENLTSKLVVAKTELKSASAARVKAVDSFTKASNKLAAVTDRFREKELSYESAKSNTKFEFENSSSKNNQVLALKKLSDWSKTSVAAAKDAINAIDEEVRNLENSQALDLLNSDIKIGFISASIPVFIFTVTAVAAIYAYLARRKRRSKFDLASNEMLAKIREQQSTLAVKKKSVKVSKIKSAGTKKKPKSSKGKK